MLQPENISTFPSRKIIGLAKRFPHIGLSESASLDRLQEEFQDFKLSPGDLPSIVKYKAADRAMRSKPGLFWSEVKNMTTLDGQPRFNVLSQLMAGLLSIPVSNADSERGFSMLRKIHRASLVQSTIIALMGMKFNCDDCCYDIKLSTDLLSACKKSYHFVRCFCYS